MLACAMRSSSKPRLQIQHGCMLFLAHTAALPPGAFGKAKTCHHWKTCLGSKNLDNMLSLLCLYCLSGQILSVRYSTVLSTLPARFCPCGSKGTGFQIRSAVSLCRAHASPWQLAGHQAQGQQPNVTQPVKRYRGSMVHQACFM